MGSATPTLEAYLETLPAERRGTLEAVLAAIRRAVPAGYQETFRAGMVTWEVPLAAYPRTYNGQPLAYVSVAAQARHFAVYLMAPYADAARVEALREAFAREGKRLDMGKSCVRFRGLEDAALGAIASEVGSLPPEAYIALHEAARRGATPRPRG
jgi:hypothetical protein